MPNKKSNKKTIKEEIKDIDNSVNETASEIKEKIENIKEEEIEKSVKEGIKKVSEKGKDIKKEVKEINNIVEDGIEKIDESLENITDEKIEKKAKDRFNNDVNLKDLTTSSVIISTCAIIFQAILTLLLVSFIVYCVLQVKDLGLSRIAEDSVIVKFVESLNSNGSFNNIVTSYSTSAGFLAVELILPIVSLIIASIALIFFWKYLNMLFKNVKKDKDLFTDAKLELVKRMRNIISLVVLEFMLLFGFGYIIFWVIAEVTMEIILYVFEYAVKKTK